VGLFNPKGREDAAAAGRSTSEPAASRPPVAQSTQSVHKPPTEGGNEVANIGKSISIKGDNQLTIGANGTINAEVNAKAVVVVGRVTGNILGTERVEIQGSGIVEGDVAAPRLVVAEGAVLNGAIKMTKQAGAAQAPKAPTAPTTSPEVRKAG
jgi:hypothetical protein